MCHKSHQRTNNSLIYRLIIVQILVIIFLCINILLIGTFFKTESFHTSARYLLFAVMLLSDSFLLFVSDIMMVFASFQLTMQVFLCVIFSAVVLLYNMVTPITLTVMTLERYVAICMPLRHAELCSPRSTVHCILIIHGISSIPLNVFILYTATVSVLFFAVVAFIILFTYVRILLETRKLRQDRLSVRRAMHTVLLHGFQLLLCILAFTSPITESLVVLHTVWTREDIAFFNYFCFILVPRFLSPLIYGFRDQVLRSHMVKNFLFCSKNIKPLFKQ
uniref:Odorant receptor, family 95, subfamily A, member 1 n=1 Tax=Oryzias sinensis TaxID=183150 RepID=A0A8C7ZBE0_9TELE